jgi:two-component system sensor histidine kinase UhpB
MSLRFRVVLAIVLVLLAGSAIGIALAGWQAQSALREELGAALSSGRQSVASAFEDLTRSRQRDPDLMRIVRAFDGDRHLSVQLIAPDGAVRGASQPLAGGGSPAWFAGLFDAAAPLDMPIPGPGRGVVRLTPLAADDIGAIWTEFVDLALVLAASIAVTAALAWLTVGHALRPLGEIAAALSAIGSGRYDTRVDDRGARELRRLTRGVNDMAARLAAMQARTQALERQLLTLQDEERADLARDLHDEMGPHLFAVSVDAAMARRLIDDGQSSAAIDQLGSIQRAVALMQRMVRDILGRLRPTELIELGLSAAVGELVAFWRGRHRDVRFEVTTPPDESAITGPVRETLYRFVQEGLSNAIRHGRPDRVSIRISIDQDEVEARITDDGARAAEPGPDGFGLSGMRERLAAVGGRLEIARGDPGVGWTLIARAPVSAATVADLMASAA